MKHFLILFIVLFQLQAQAESPRAFLESTAFDTLCSQTVYKKPPFEAIGSTWSNFYLLKRPVFSETPDFIFVGLEKPTGEYTVRKIDKLNPSNEEVIYSSTVFARDLVVMNNQLWLLGSYTLTRVDLATSATSVLTLSKEGEQHKMDHAYDMVGIGSLLYIAHGTRGVVVVDTETNTIVKTIDIGMVQSNGHKSLASSIVAVNSKRLLVGADNLTMPQPESKPFNGLVDLQIGGGYKKYPYRTGILSSQSKLVVSGNTLWINNWGTLQFAALDAIAKDAAVFTNYIPMTFFAEEKKWAAEPMGEFFVLGSDVFFCAKRSQLMTSQPTDKKGISYKIPNAGKQTPLEFKKYKLEAKLKWIDGPYVSDYKKSSIAVELYDQKGQLESLPSGLTLGFYATMPSMGHPAVDMGYFENPSTGTYLNSNIVLGMPGDWKMELMIYDQNNNVLERITASLFL